MKNRRGVTITEMVIYLGILSVLLVVFVNMFAVLVNRQLETEGLSSTQIEASYLLSRMSYDFGRASSIEVPTVPGSSSATLRFVAGGTTYDYVASAGALMLKTAGGADRITSDGVSITTPTFLRLGIGNTHDVIQVQFDITSAAKTTAGNDVVHFSTVLGIRDK